MYAINEIKNESTTYNILPKISQLIGFKSSKQKLNTKNSTINPIIVINISFVNFDMIIYYLIV